MAIFLNGPESNLLGGTFVDIQTISGYLAIAESNTAPSKEILWA